MAETVWLQRAGGDVPWGFRLSGGRDFQQPLTVQRVTAGSVAATGLSIDDVILRIGDTDASSLTNSQAMELVKCSGNMLQLTISKGGSTGHQPYQNNALENKMADMNVGSNSYGRQNSYGAPSYGGSGQTTDAANPPYYGNNTAYQPTSYGGGTPQGGSYGTPQGGSYGTPQGGFSYGTPQGGSYGSPQGRGSQGSTPNQGHAMPDAVLNMAAKGGPDKKPFAYAPDMGSIQEQRDKVRRRTTEGTGTPSAALPRYQNMLNMPQFDDKPLGPLRVAPATPPTSPPAFAPGPGSATVAHLQYNSPITMYSEKNVAETFEGQTEGVVTGVSGLKKDEKDITQSPVYRMIHGLDNNKPKLRPMPPDAHGAKPVLRAPAQDDEVTFSGVNRPAEIPSKSFHRLQKMTNNAPEIDTTSIRQNVRGEEEGDVGDYDQTSIRYTGRNIPSKSFKMLQSMTGSQGMGNELTVPGRRPRRRPDSQQPEPQPNSDEIVDISYVGGNIPSRSFKVLQKSVGGPGNGSPQQPQPVSQAPSGGQYPQGVQGYSDGEGHGAPRNVKVIRLRQQPQRVQDDNGVTDF